MHASFVPPAVDVIESSAAVLAQAGRMVRLLPQQAESQGIAFLIGPTQERMELPEAICRVLYDAVAILSRGDAVVIGSVHQLLTTTEAADLLGISRQYLIRLIENK